MRLFCLIEFLYDGYLFQWTFEARFCWQLSRSPLVGKTLPPSRSMQGQVARHLLLLTAVGYQHRSNWPETSVYLDTYPNMICSLHIRTFPSYCIWMMYMIFPDMYKHISNHHMVQDIVQSSLDECMASAPTTTILISSPMQRRRQL